jgi:hypothetical protein
MQKLQKLSKKYDVALEKRDIPAANKIFVEMLGQQEILSGKVIDRCNSIFRELNHTGEITHSRILIDPRSCTGRISINYCGAKYMKGKSYETAVSTSLPLDFLSMLKKYQIEELLCCCEIRDAIVPLIGAEALDIMQKWAHIIRNVSTKKLDAAKEMRLAKIIADGEEATKRKKAEEAAAEEFVTVKGEFENKTVEEKDDMEIKELAESILAVSVTVT